MPFADLYRAQVALLIRILPIVAEQKAFALKGHGHEDDRASR
jgi:hypothetical protein